MLTLLLLYSGNIHVLVHERLRDCEVCYIVCAPESKFTDDLRTVLRQLSELRQSYDNWRIHRTLTTIVRPILRPNITITF